MPSRHNLFVGVVTALSLILCVWPLAACTVFFTFDGTLALAGDNEDWGDPNTQMWVVPAEADQHAVIYFGFGRGIYPPKDVADRKVKIPQRGITAIRPEDLYGHPQQGMNDQGLFFGGAATEVIEPAAIAGREKPDGQPLVHRVMRNCATVAEALELLGRYDIGLIQGQLMFGDKFGDACIIEAGNVVIRKQDKSLVMTNFLASRRQPEQIECRRYRHVQSRLAQQQTSSHALVRSLLKETSVDWTQYSTIFDCTNGTLTVYRKGDFETSITLHVRREAEKGRKCVSIEELFSQDTPK